MENNNKNCIIEINHKISLFTPLKCHHRTTTGADVLCD